MYYSIPVNNNKNLDKVTKINIILRRVAYSEYLFDIYFNNKRADIEGLLYDKFLHSKDNNNAFNFFRAHFSIVEKHASNPFPTKKFIYFTKIVNSASAEQMFRSDMSLNFSIIINRLLHPNIYNFFKTGNRKRIERILNENPFSKSSNIYHSKFYLKVHPVF